MSSFAYLLIRSAKNTFLELLRKPGKLAVWIIVLALIIGLLVMSVFTRAEAGEAADLIWLKGVFFAFIMIFVVIAIKKGLSNGDIIFEMNDVNLLFVSPISPRSILGYGIFRMAKMSFLAGFFLLFQGNTLSSVFGVGFDGVLILLLGFMVAVSLLQIISLLIYSQTNGRAGRKRLVKIISIALFLPLIGFTVLQYIRTPDVFLTLEHTLSSPYLTWAPVAGWVAEGVVALIAGEVSQGLLFFGLMLVAGGLLILYIALSNPDYYEDVLLATETMFEKKRAMAEGQINTEGNATRKVRVVKTGIGGEGASAVFHKHIRESFRANRFGLWGMSSVIALATALFMLLILRNTSGGLLTVLQVLMWVQIFTIGTGRGLKELYSHYIYMIPESSFKKILWSNYEISFKVLIEGIVIFSLLGFVLKESALVIAGSIAVYVLFSLLLLGINYLSLRWTGADISAGLLMTIYIIMVIVILAPGLIAAIVVGSMLGNNGIIIGLGILAAWELLTGLGCFALSKGILHRCDMPVMRTGK